MSRLILLKVVASIGAVSMIVSLTNLVAILPDVLFFILEIHLRIFSGVISLDLSGACFLRMMRTNNGICSCHLGPFYCFALLRLGLFQL